MSSRQQRIDAVTRAINTNPEIRQEINDNLHRPIQNWSDGGHYYQYEVRDGQFVPTTRVSPEEELYWQRHPGGSIEAILKKHGLEPPNQDYRLQQEGGAASGDFSFDRAGYWDRNKDWLIPLIAGGTLATAGLLLPVVGPAAGVGIGETAATTGIAGPVAGLGVTAAPAITTVGAVAAPAAAAIPAATAPSALTPLAAAPAAVPIENALTDRTPPDTGQPPLLSHPNIPPGSNVGNPPAGGTVEDYLRNYYSNSGSGTGKTIDELLRQYYGNGGGNNGGVDTTGLLLGLGGSLISALGAVRPQQRQSFQGTKADPINILSGAQQAIGGEAPLLFDRAKQGGELTAPMPGHLPTFTGGGMPMPVGVTPPSSGVPPLGLRRNTGQASTQPASQDELDHLYSSLSLIGGRR